MSGGRKPVTYHLQADMFHILCVAMDQFTTRISVTDMHNNFVLPVHEFELKLYNNPDAAHILANEFALFLKLASIDTGKIKATGIAMPGFVNEADGVNYICLQVTDAQNLKDYLAKKLSMPVFIFNDLNAVAQAELKFGLGCTIRK